MELYINVVKIVIKYFIIVIFIITKELIQLLTVIHIQYEEHFISKIIYGSNHGP